jgi:uncharacterized protein (DUF1499 family)
MLIKSVLAMAMLFGIGIVGLASMSWFAKKPGSLGLTEDGKLRPCGNKPNCVCTFEKRETHAIDPLTVIADDSIMSKIRDVVDAMPRSMLVDKQNNYLHFEFRSRWFRFVDDVEIAWIRETDTLHFRSASRSGHSDLGVNRRRVERIKAAIQATLTGS